MDGDNSELEAVSAADLAALSSAACDAHLRISGDAVSMWSSDAAIRAGLPLVDIFAAEDAPAVAGLLSGAPAGPVWARLRGAGGSSRWVVVLAAPSASGWMLQLRDAHRLDPAMNAVTGSGPLDDVTGAAGRDQVLNEVAWLLSATPRTGKEIAVAACDLDDFASVNDEFGWEAGDEVLRVVTGRISDALRSGDLVARIEEDQLLVVLRGVHHLRGAIRVANKIRAAVEDPILLPFGEVEQTVSVGVTLISRGESVDAVLERAESALTMAKGNGRNRVMSSPPI